MQCNAMQYSTTRYNATLDTPFPRATSFYTFKYEHGIQTLQLEFDV